MSSMSLISFAGAVLEDRDLGALLLGHDSRQHFGSRDVRSTDLDLLIIDDHQHLVQLDLLTGIDGQFLDADDISNASAVLTRA
jgi:hypothetical protein